ncbi:MAG: hypothetical protein JSW08_03410 [archaeon]|nr:MAG: hypothetical protein JSW08_03410 [archaeon]
MILEPNYKHLAHQILARERRYTQICSPTPKPITAFWQEGIYNGAYQILFPTQPEIALVTKSNNPIIPEVLEELRRQDPGRLELNVDPEIKFDLSPRYILRLFLDEKRLGMVTEEQKDFAERNLSRSSIVILNFSLGSDPRDN